MDTDLDKMIDELKSEVNKKEVEFVNKSLKALKLAQLLQEFEKQGNIYEIRGDYFYRKGKLKKARNDYLLASRIARDKNSLIKKIDKVEERE